MSLIRTSVVSEAPQRDAAIQQLLGNIARIQEQLRTTEDFARSLLTIDWQGGHSREVQSLITFGYLGKDGNPHEGDAALPTPEELKARFSPKAKIAITHLRDRRLALKPRTTFSRKVRALDAAPVESIRDQTHVHKAYGPIDRSPNAHDPVSAWDVSWIEGAPTPSVDASYDDPKKPLGYRRAVFLAHRAKIHLNLTGIDRHDWDALLRQSLTEGTPIDLRTWIAFDDDEANSVDCIPGANFVVGQALFGTYHPGSVVDDVRFRSSVREDVHP